MTGTRVGVVMPVHNGADYLAAALDSVLTQSLSDLELVVVDDRSTDQTPRILVEYAKRDPRVRVVPAAGTGLADALNIGWRATRCEYIARMDADDLALPDRLARQAAALDADAELVALGGAIELIDMAGRVVGHESYPTDDASIRATLRRASALAHPTVMMRRDALEAVGGYRSIFSYAEDYDLWLRLAERGRLANLADPVLRYRLHPGQQSSNKVWQQATYRLAARAAADLRADTGTDPLAGLARLDEVTLAALGVDQAAVRQVSRDQWAWWAVLMTRVGDLAAADRAWREAHRAIMPGPTAAADRARLRWREATALRRRGHPVRAHLVRVRRRIVD